MLCFISGSSVADIQFERNVFEVNEGEAVEIRLDITPLVENISVPIEITVVAENGVPPLDARKNQLFMISSSLTTLSCCSSSDGLFTSECDHSF